MVVMTHGCALGACCLPSLSSRSLFELSLCRSTTMNEIRDSVVNCAENHPNSLRCHSLNARSIVNKRLQLTAVLVSQNPDVLAVRRSWEKTSWILRSWTIHIEFSEIGKEEELCFCQGAPSRRFEGMTLTLTVNCFGMS